MGCEKGREVILRRCTGKQCVFYFSGGRVDILIHNLWKQRQVRLQWMLETLKSWVFRRWLVWVLHFPGLKGDHLTKDPHTCSAKCGLGFNIPEYSQRSGHFTDRVLWRCQGVLSTLIPRASSFLSIKGLKCCGHRPVRMQGHQVSQLKLEIGNTRFISSRYQGGNSLWEFHSWKQVHFSKRNRFLKNRFVFEWSSREHLLIAIDQQVFSFSYVPSGAGIISLYFFFYPLLASKVISFKM